MYSYLLVTRPIVIKSDCGWSLIRSIWSSTNGLQVYLNLIHCLSFKMFQLPLFLRILEAVDPLAGQIEQYSELGSGGTVFFEIP